MNLRRITEFQGRISFPNFDSHFQTYLDAFKTTRLGKIHSAIPWEELVKTLKIKEHKKGPRCHFSPQGKVALMFLKNYSGCSDSDLIDQLNGNIYYQIFCDIILSPGEHIKNFKIVSQIRCEIAATLKISEAEQVLMDSWRPYMTNLNSITCDATCYESSIKYPTDIKLLFDSVVWIYGELKGICTELKIRMPRSKYLKWVRRAVSYSKMKKKRKKKRRSLTRGLLRLLKKLLGELNELLQEHELNAKSERTKNRKQTIEIILKQQSEKFYEGKRPKDAVVSIDKPHIRPIVRGKENKLVEFGAKVHKLQIDGISFIEHLSFDAFNEGVRLKDTIFRAQQLTRQEVKLVGADAIYATNENRKHTSSKGIQTDFKPKGRPGKHRQHKVQLAKMITKERASCLEGSFGTDKEYFLLNKIKARTKQTEILWIFFGIHTSNAIKIGHRMAQKRAQAA